MSDQTATISPAPAVVDIKSEKFTPSDYLTKAELAQANAMAETWKKSPLSITDIVHVGDRELAFMGTAAKKLVDATRLNEAPEVGKLVLSAVNQMRNLSGKRPQPDPKFTATLQKGGDFLDSIGNKIGIFRSTIQAYFDQAQTIGHHLDEIKAGLIKHLGTMEDGVTTMDTMLMENNGWIKQALIVAAALENYQAFLSGQIENAAQLWPGEDDRQNNVALLTSKVTLLEKKLGDLKPRIFAGKNASREFIMSRDGDAVNAMGLNSFITTGINAWTEQIAMIVNRYRQEQTAQVLDVAHDFMQEILTAGAAAVQESAETAARILQQQMIDAETLDNMTNSIITAGQTWLTGIQAANAKHLATEKAIRANMDKLEKQDNTLEQEAMKIARSHNS